MKYGILYRAPSRISAFTLLELLVAVALLAMLLTIVTQLVNSASIATVQSVKRLDADTQARTLFERMGVDFSNMVKRSDVDTLVHKATGNDKIFFFSQSPAFYDSSLTYNVKSGVALVGYRVTEQNGDAANFAPPFSLERLCKGLKWDGTPTGGAAPGSVVFNSGTITPDNTISGTWADVGSTAPYVGTSDAYHVIAEQVLRMEICFQVKDLSTPGSTGVAYSNFPVAVGGPTTITSGLPTGGTPGSRWYDTTSSRAYIYTGGLWQPNGFKDVLSIIVTIAVLDGTSRKIISDLTPCTQLFADPDETNDLKATPARLPLKIWNSALEAALSGNSLGLPKSAAACIRIYQRHFSLSSPSTK